MRCAACSATSTSRTRASTSDLFPAEQAADGLAQHADGGDGERAEIKPHGAVGDPLEVVGELLRHRGLVAAADLREAREARADDEALPVRRQLLRELLVEPRADRP